MLTIHSKVPKFSLNDQHGVLRNSNEFKGKWLVIYFYPKDDTPGCTIEACSFRDHFSVLRENEIEVIGISKDSPQSHKKFVEKFELPFTLLADPDLSITKAFGAWGQKKILGVPYQGILRNTYLIDPHGVVQKIYEDVEPADHALQILEDWKNYNSR